MDIYTIIMILLLIKIIFNNYGIFAICQAVF